MEKLKIKYGFNYGCSQKISTDFDEPSECPICKQGIKPHYLNGCDYNDDTGNWYVVITYRCPRCQHPFIAFHQVDIPKDETELLLSVLKAELISVEPQGLEKKAFPSELHGISPSFEKIYNQALAAENLGLNEISGMGYRKALEFLIKEYLIHTFPDEKEIIEEMELGNCIANKIDVPEIRLPAQRCTWLANDYVHYKKRYNDYDLQMLKRLIDATVYWICMKAVNEAAAKIENRKKSKKKN